MYRLFSYLKSFVPVRISKSRQPKDQMSIFSFGIGGASNKTEKASETKSCTSFDISDPPGSIHQVSSTDSKIFLQV